MDRLALRKVYVYDFILRFLHGVIGISTALLICTGLYACNLQPGADQAAMWDFHIQCGNVLSVAFVGRVLWGFIGPAWSRWTQLFHIRAWIFAVRTRQYQFDSSKIGHDPFAAIAYLAFYGVVFVVLVSGWLLSGMIHGHGPFAATFFDDLENQFQLHEVHEWGFWLIAAFVVTHIVAIVFHEVIHHIPISQSMVSGFQFRTVKEDKNEHK